MKQNFTANRIYDKQLNRVSLKRHAMKHTGIFEFMDIPEILSTSNPAGIQSFVWIQNSFVGLVAIFLLE